MTTKMSGVKDGTSNTISFAEDDSMGYGGGYSYLRDRLAASGNPGL